MGTALFRIRPARPSAVVSAVIVLELVYHGIVRNVRKSHGNPLMSLFLNVMQTIILVAVFYVMFSVLSIRHLAIRGDFLVYLMSGIFLYLTHVKTVGAVAGAEGAASPMMQHAPMTPAVSILSAALGTLYIQLLSMMLVMFGYHVLVQPFEIERWDGFVGMLILSWFAGVAVGLIFYALKPWAPAAVTLLTTIYRRVNMIASGKMFVANTLPPFMLAMFDWNPLFHAIDQARGFAFINYTPRNSSIDYPLMVSIALLVLGLMGEFYTRRKVSISWSARS